jgi:hypothetical protein
MDLEEYKKQENTIASRTSAMGLATETRECTYSAVELTCSGGITLTLGLKSTCAKGLYVTAWTWLNGDAVTYGLIYLYCTYIFVNLSPGLVFVHPRS